MTEDLIDAEPGVLRLAEATAADAAEAVEVIHAAFGARPPLDPPSTAQQETAESVQATLAAGGGVVARMGGVLAGVILIGLDGDTAVLRRVSVHPRFQRHGVGSAMVAAIEPYAAELGSARIRLVARREIADLAQFWLRRGFTAEDQDEHYDHFVKPLPVVVIADTADETREVGRRLAPLLRAGDVVIAQGDLGAGKTTLTQGLATGLDVTGPVISPTFVLSRIHHARGSGPDLVHVDAYRLADAAELDDLGLELDRAVTVVEWGTGLAEHLAADPLRIAIHRQEVEIAESAPAPSPALTGDPAAVDVGGASTGADEDIASDPRTILVGGSGPRWSRDELAAALADLGPERS